MNLHTDEPGHYEAPFFPTVETTYNYTLFGDINGTAFRATWTCNPAGGESEPMSDNSTVQISEGVTRKGMVGGFGCPLQGLMLDFQNHLCQITK